MNDATHPTRTDEEAGASRSGVAAKRDGRRLLVVNADDLGASTGVNQGVIRAHREGIVTSASLMVRRPAAHDAVALCRECPRLSLGLHLDLGEWELRNGEWRAVYEILPLGNSAEVAGEIERQAALFREYVGRNPSHLDSHQHVHRNEIRPLAVALARRLGIPLRHFGGISRYCGEFYGQLPDGTSDPNRLTASALAGILAGLQPGLTELACHPASCIDFETMYGAERLAELDTLCDRAVRIAVEELGIELWSFQDVIDAGRFAA